MGVPICRSIFPVSLSKTLEVCSKLTEIQAGKGTCRLDIQDAMQRLALDVILRVAFDIDGRNVEFGQCQLLENIHYCFDEIYRYAAVPPGNGKQEIQDTEMGLSFT
jgi:hypothetical protein